jgi:hypothetical protein
MALGRQGVRSVKSWQVCSSIWRRCMLWRTTEAGHVLIGIQRDISRNTMFTSSLASLHQPEGFHPRLQPLHLRGVRPGHCQGQELVSLRFPTQSSHRCMQAGGLHQTAFESCSGVLKNGKTLGQRDKGKKSTLGRRGFGIGNPAVNLAEAVTTIWTSCGQVRRPGSSEQ